MKKMLMFLCLLPLFGYGQDSAQQKIDRLKEVKSMPYICENGYKNQDCGDPVFWEVVKLKKEAIPLLVNKLDDTTTTKASVPLFGYQYTVADIALSALEEIIHGLPTFELLEVEFDQEGCGYCAYWQHVNAQLKNRKKFKRAVKKWIRKQQDDLFWRKSDRFNSCDCRGTHPNRGHYELRN